ncbi:hypothetical protein BT63DRAFT_268945 [Microthyrium microscopicum]|uniref:Phox-like protein n=1 Tax=Microthyrium microscopicum TaxID=703497 RepID=A0A6A6UAI1_9PEZI|nr:hypothetical protein BT63DRAFT_268945 [Microthyrium microscopicum]
MPYTLSIPTTTLQSDSSNKPYTSYHLTITTPLRKLVLTKRYSDFVSLHTALTNAAGASPPTPLPGKSWFSRTVNNPKLTESRRAGLESYARSIEDAPDGRWREAGVWRSFLNFPASPNVPPKQTNDESTERPTMSAAAWLDLHTNLKQLLQDARNLLARREAASSTTAAHEASAGAKKSLVKAHTLIVRLEEGLRGFSTGKGSERLGDGEIRRRRDLVARARKEREALEGVLNAWVARSSAPQASSTPSYSSSPVRSAASMPGSYQSSATGRGGRVLGGPAKETEKTRQLDNEGVLKLQKEIMQNQDMSVDALAEAVRRMKGMGVAINEELVEQSQLLDVLDTDVDRLGGKVDIAKKRIRKLN